MTFDFDLIVKIFTVIGVIATVIGVIVAIKPSLVVRRFAMRWVFLGMVSVVLVIAIALRWESWIGKQHWDKIRDTQRLVTQIDARVERLLQQGLIEDPSIFQSDSDDDWHLYRHVDPYTNEHLATDEFFKGRLKRRLLFHNGRHVATDEYEYDEKGNRDDSTKVMEKNRRHLDEQKRAYLLDYYRPPGWAIWRKRDCSASPGTEDNCTNHEDLFEPDSPVPNVVYIPSLYQFPIYYR